MKRNKQFGPMDEHLRRLREFHAQDPEASISRQICRLLEDPLQPLNTNGRFRINPVLVWLAAILALAVGTFLFFSFGKS